VPEPSLAGLVRVETLIVDFGLRNSDCGFLRPFY
jgi:hypothetical protein